MEHNCDPTWHGKILRSCGLAMTTLSCFLILSGCGSSRPKQFRIDGKITFDGAPPPADGSVYFAPKMPAVGFPARGGYGTFKKGDGHFNVGSGKDNDGLMPGTYQVKIDCLKSTPTEDGEPGVSYVPKGYVPPDLEIKIDDTQPVEFHFDISGSNEM